MKIAIIGSGISGMATAHYLAPEHDITLFESSSVLGGHTATIDVHRKGRDYAIDTGFIVFNDWTYPAFITLMESLGVASQPTPMSFSVSDKRSGIEYAGSSLDTLFAQRRNIFSPRFLALVSGILRFNRQAEQHMADDPTCASMSLEEYLESYGYPAFFRDLYLVPMGAAIWSSGSEAMLKFPLQFFVRFFRNHGLLNIRHRPQWRVIQGGSRNYIAPLTATFKNSIELANSVKRVTRVPKASGAGYVVVESERFTATYDQVVFACHSDQALRILGDADPVEQTVLSAISYTRNAVVLHTDTTLLPANRKCWSSWNMSMNGPHMAMPALTYNMNILQGIAAQETFCVTLNQTNAIDPACILGEYEYDHPLFSADGMLAQQRWENINGVRNTWFCGAYWRNGFHEDGVWSALRVATAIARIPQFDVKHQPTLVKAM